MPMLKMPQLSDFHCTNRQTFVHLHKSLSFPAGYDIDAPIGRR